MWGAGLLWVREHLPPYTWVNLCCLNRSDWTCSNDLAGVSPSGPGTENEGQDMVDQLHHCHRYSPLPSLNTPSSPSHSIPTLPYSTHYCLLLSLPMLTY